MPPQLPKRRYDIRLLQEIAREVEDFRLGYADLLKRLGGPTRNKDDAEARYVAWFEQFAEGTLLDEPSAKQRLREAFLRKLSPIWDLRSRVEEILVVRAGISDSHRAVLTAFRGLPFVREFEVMIRFHPDRTLVGLASLQALLRGALTQSSTQLEVVRSPKTRAAPQVVAAIQEFPQRAKWLDEHLRARGWNRHDPHRHNGPDNKTVQKILLGMKVGEEVLEKLARALSTKRGTINLLDIPRN